MHNSLRWWDYYNFYFLYIWNRNNEYNHWIFKFKQFYKQTSKNNASCLYYRILSSRASGSSLFNANAPILFLNDIAKKRVKVEAILSPNRLYYENPLLCIEPVWLAPLVSGWHNVIPQGKFHPTDRSEKCCNLGGPPPSKTRGFSALGGLPPPSLLASPPPLFCGLLLLFLPPPPSYQIDHGSRRHLSIN